MGFQPDGDPTTDLMVTVNGATRTLQETVTMALKENVEDAEAVMAIAEMQAAVELSAVNGN
jgi:hypothetical protein